MHLAGRENSVPNTDNDDLTRLNREVRRVTLRRRHPTIPQRL